MMQNSIFIVTLSILLANVSGTYQFFGNAISFFLELTKLQSSILPLYPPYIKPITESYDFIIIGSSPSGCVLANRLTENPDVSVLLVENGEEASSIVDIPVAAGALEFMSYNYGYKTEPNPGFCKGCPNGQLEYPHGNALGGSSIINYMIFVRGNKLDYDKWEAMGNPGWSYKDMLPYFIKIEDVHVAKSDNEIRGHGGYLTVSDVSFRSKMVDVYVQAATEAGHAYVDYNGNKQLGVSYIQSTTRKGTRCSAEKAYLRPVRERKNLKIQFKSKVTRILIDKKTQTAYGIEYDYDKKKHVVYANKEVILSAGALNSPQVLMLSGIGPKKHLNEMGIPVIKDLPVGKKMYDHVPFAAIMYEVNENLVINALSAILNPVTYFEFFFGKGVFTSIGGVEAITYIKTNISTESDPLYPDIELLMIGISLATDYGIIFRKIFNIPPNIYDKLFKPLEGKNIYQVLPTLLHPKSCGYIKLKSKNPYDPPLFYPNFFSDPENNDIKTLIAGIREFQRINTMPTLRKYKATLIKIPVPGCEQHKFDSDQYWECAIRTVTGSFYHQVATCKMGPADDPEAVVDNKLKVYGIKKLRVVDTSVIPLPPSAHNVGPAYAIGEKAADIIKAEMQI